VVESLTSWARKIGFAFLRVLHYERHCIDSFSALPKSDTRSNWFPFNAPPKENLIVHQRPDESEMLSGFQKIARQEIKAAREYGYEIQITRDSRALCEIWHIFQKQGRQKGITYGSVDKYALLMDKAKPQGLADLYVARLSGKVVYAALICKGSRSAYHLIGALDRDAMSDAPTPSCLLHWTAMRDVYRQGITEYNLGTRSGPVYAFKRKFRPEQREVPSPVSIICSPLKFHVWTALLSAHTGLQKVRSFKKADKVLRRLLMRTGQTNSRGKVSARTNSEDLPSMSNLPRRT
jgi:lipid II:glycine glycyltransferase (peptidoglycan interpeptide bridge formation enzyme)